MKKTPELIKKKWELKRHQLKNKTELSHKNKIINLRQILERDKANEFQKKALSYEKKKNAYLNKKEKEYKRKCENEIRQLEGKPEKVYKPKKRSRSAKLNFALQIEQENAKLRDTDPEGNGFCCSCGEKKTRAELAWGHYFSRMIQAVCLWMENINAQCHKCNLTMWPLGNATLKAKVQHYYYAVLKEKYGSERIQEMEDMVNKRVTNPKKYSPTEPFLDELIPDLIDENERLRKTKTFQPAQRKNRRKIYNKQFIQ